MKKYLFGTLAILLAIGLSSFTKKTISTDYLFRLTALATGSNLQQVPSSGPDAGKYFTNWELVESFSCTPGSDRACTIAVSEEYIKEISSAYRLLAQDIVLEGKEAFPMSVANGEFSGGTQYKVVATSDETGHIDVINLDN
jgi:hypothetical protein